MDFKINEHKLNSIISESVNKILREFANDTNAIESIKNNIMSKIIGIEQQIESLQEKLELLNQLPSILEKIDKEIVNMFKGNVISNASNGNIVYTLQEPLDINDCDIIEENLNDFLVPAAFNDMIEILVLGDDKNQNVINKIKVYIELD